MRENGKTGGIVVLAAVLCWSRGNADESQTSIGEIPLCDLGTGAIQMQ